MTFRRNLHSPIGNIVIESDGEYIIAIRIEDPTQPNSATTPHCIIECETQLREYFDHKRTLFNLPLQPHGSSFQCRIWEILRNIPYAQTRNYKEIACAAGNEKAVRAVANACGANPICIVIPCHRVVGTHNLGGYSAGKGTETKLQLLTLEREVEA